MCNYELPYVKAVDSYRLTSRHTDRQTALTLYTTPLLAGGQKHGNAKTK